ncbi:MAG TPA: N-6 DNA methylase [Longimicrobiales bacterium]
MQLTLEVHPAHTNRQLFSNHFLEQRLRGEPLWAAVEVEAERVRQVLRQLHAEQRAALEGASEAQTEERWIRPVLKALGWGFEVQPRSSRQGTTQFPDYALFPDPADATSAARLGDHRHVLKRASGILEAKRWGRDLDGRGVQGDRDPNRVPSTQIINYLIRAEQPWGILTNGIAWRLYCRDADFADTVYFAVNLPDLLGDAELQLGEQGESIPAAEAFRYFYLFFRPQAFRVELEGQRWLDLVRARSAHYARGVEEALKPRAYRAVTALCRGFAVAEGMDGAVLAADAERSRVVLDNALTLLFRLLFLLYAESRDLLPVRTNAAYRSKSLLALRERAAQARDAGAAHFRRGRDLWNDLQDLFRIVDGDPAWRDVGIPVYNGGLFDPAKHPWLEAHYVADPQMAEALDLLSRVEDPETGRLHFVDYGPLDVRHLGSIYEGLLEHVIRVATDDLPAIREHGQVVRDPVPAGELYLATDKGERKATGSFYTPDPIVQYIVERALGPLVEGRSVAEILELKVLDPAMGSGHFLVAATAFLARAAVRAAADDPQPVLGDFAVPDPEYLRRLVVERCIFGVDKNPRAVELAKLSLWLATVQKDKPLNFLDHHLKCGDSLLGARIRELGGLSGRKSKEAALEAAGQYNAFDGAFRKKLIQALAFIDQIEHMPSEAPPDVERKENLYRQADALLGRFREAADVWVSRGFGNILAKDPEQGERDDREPRRREGEGDNYARMLDALLAPQEAWDAIRAEPWFRRARALASQHRFFHWEVEFGEVFYDAMGRDREMPGFDAVLGNPPYVRMEEFKELKGFLRAAYESYETRSDLYVYFIERSLALLRTGGEYGVILSNKFLRANYGKPVRRLIAREAAVREIVDFGELPVFDDAAAMPALFFATADRATETPRFAQMVRLEFDDLRQEIERRAFQFDREGILGEEWRIVPAEVAALMAKVEGVGRALGEVPGVRIGWGIKTGLNAAFFLDDATRERLIAEDPRSEEVIKPLVVGDDVRRYRIDGHLRQWILYLPHGVDIARYPAVERHLEPFRQRLEKRATKQVWYELQQPQENYIEFFEGGKILYPEIAREARFSFHRGPLYPNNKCFFIPGEDGFLLALLNSRLLFFYLRQVCASLGDPGQRGRIELRAQYMERLPIRRIEPTTPPDTRHALGERLRSLYEDGLRAAGLDPTRADGGTQTVPAGGAGAEGP